MAVSEIYRTMKIPRGTIYSWVTEGYIEKSKQLRKKKRAKKTKNIRNSKE